MSKDKAGKAYWDHLWEVGPAFRETVDPRAKGLNHYVHRKFHEFFCDVFAGLATNETTLLEIGCASSQWLPYFAKEFNFLVYGLDYSEQGCQQARQGLEEGGVKGEVVWCDFFRPPQSMLGAFDVVVSFGVVEHFEDTAGCLRAFAEFLKPGGILITNIPNMVGLVGAIQKLADRQVFDIHVPLDQRALTAAHQPIFEVLSCRYFLFVNLNVVNIDNWKNQLFYRVVVRLRSWLTKGCWILERLVPVFEPNHLTSPYINCVAKKLDASPSSLRR